MKIDKRIKKKLAAKKNLETVVRFRGYPVCFESKVQYGDWLEAETVIHTLKFEKNVCEDCTVDYQKRMILEKKCVNKDFLVKNQ
jgi:hypothetical protein